MAKYGRDSGSTIPVKLVEDACLLSACCVMLGLVISSARIITTRSLSSTLLPFIF